MLRKSANWKAFTKQSKGWH